MGQRASPCRRAVLVAVPVTSPRRTHAPFASGAYLVLSCGCSLQHASAAPTRAVVIGQPAMVERGSMHTLLALAWPPVTRSLEMASRRPRMPASVSMLPTSCGPFLGASGVREPDPSLFPYIALTTIILEEAEERARYPAVRAGQRAGFHA